VTTRRKVLTEQVVFRAPEDLYEALQRDADENGRTMAQSARFHLERAFGLRP